LADQKEFTLPLSPYFSTAPDQVIQWVCDARQCTFELVADLSDAQLMGPMLPTINPLLWEIGHHAWFQSRWALRHAGGTPVRDNEDALYDSIAIAHDIRWDLPLPSRADTLEYLRTVRDRTVGRLEHSPSAADIYHAVYATLHEDMHTEAITYTRQTLGYAAPQLSIAPQKHSDSAAAGGGPLLGDAHIPGGTFMLGSTAEEPFPFDNEKWAHPVTIQPFAIGRAPVTQAEFLAFVEDGGYQNRSHWDEDGWEWRTQTESKHPVYWRRGDGWQRRHFDRWVPLEQHLPVIHVNWHETQAYCRWAGRRLPSEAEWQAAAAAEPDAAGGLAQRQRRFPWGDEAPSPERANLDWRLMGCLEVGALPQGDSAFGCRQMVGNLWEWTDSVFRPFPGFEPDPYKEYSQPWFETRKVMLGGCWATRSRLIRNNYRNFQTPDRRDIWVGFRTCAL
jgi:gamma-glutamyl hercynylcysteine S-oxide synthase